MQLYTLEANLQLTPEIAQRLAKSQKAEVRRSIAKNPNTPAGVLPSLLAEFPAEVLQNAALPLLLLEEPTLFTKITSDDGYVLAQVLFHQDFPAQLREGVFLSKLRTAWSLKGLLTHPLCTKSLLLLGLRALESSYAKEQVLEALLLHPEVTEAEILALNNTGSTSTRLALARCKVAPRSMLTALLADKNGWIRELAATNPNTPKDALALLSRAGASLDLRRFTTPQTLSSEERSRLRAMGPFGEALWVRQPGTPTQALIFKPEPLWLEALLSGPPISKALVTQIKTWMQGRRRKVRHMRSQLRERGQAEKRKLQKKERAPVRPRCR